MNTNTLPRFAKVEQIARTAADAAYSVPRVRYTVARVAEIRDSLKRFEDWFPNAERTESEARKNHTGIKHSGVRYVAPIMPHRIVLARTLAEIEDSGAFDLLPPQYNVFPNATGDGAHIDDGSNYVAYVGGMDVSAVLLLAWSDYLDRRGVRFGPGGIRGTYVDEVAEIVATYAPLVQETVQATLWADFVSL